MTENNRFTFPVGYEDFLYDQNMNYQLNKLYSFGYARLEDLKEIAPKIKNYTDWKKELVKIAEEAVSDDRLLNAAFYYRAAEYFTSIKDPDKDVLYDKFIELFDTFFKDDNIERVTIPYGNSSLFAIRIAPKNKSKGVIVIHGGYDTFIEEFYPIFSYMSESGYEVIAFDGPGQGGVLKKNNLVLTHEWEKPVSSVLDFFNLEDVTLIGISLGGLLAIRASAFDSRIKRVVSYGVIYDYLESQNANSPFIAKTMFKLRLKLNFSKKINDYAKQMREKDYRVDFSYNQGFYITGTKSLFEFCKYMQKFSAVKISSRVKQDVLLLVGDYDFYFPPKMYREQKKALKNAKSVTLRIFTKNERAQNHIQVGNIKKALDVIIGWIEKKS